MGCKSIEEQRAVDDSWAVDDDSWAIAAGSRRSVLHAGDTEVQRERRTVDTSIKQGPTIKI